MLKCYNRVPFELVSYIGQSASWSLLNPKHFLDTWGESNAIWDLVEVNFWLLDQHWPILPCIGVNSVPWDKRILDNSVTHWVNRLEIVLLVVEYNEVFELEPFIDLIVSLAIISLVWIALDEDGLEVWSYVRIIVAVDAVLLINALHWV